MDHKVDTQQCQSRSAEASSSGSTLFSKMAKNIEKSFAHTVYWTNTVGFEIGMPRTT